MIEQAPPIWLPPKPAIIRPAPERILSSFLPGMFPAGAASAGKIPSVVMVDRATTETDVGNTYTFTNRQFGDEHPSRMLVLGLFANHGGTNNNVVSAASIGGVSATFVDGQTGTSLSSMQLWRAHVPNGTTGTVSWTRAGAMIAASWVLWAVYDLRSMTPTDTDFLAGNPAVAAVNVAGNGVAVGFGASSLNLTFTWTGLDEDVDAQHASVGRYTGASASRLPAASPYNVSMANSSAFNASCIVASWR